MGGVRNLGLPLLAKDGRRRPVHIGCKRLGQRHGNTQHAIRAVCRMAGMAITALVSKIVRGCMVRMRQRQIQRRGIDAADIRCQCGRHRLGQHPHLHACQRGHQQQQRKNRRDQGGKAGAAAQALEHGEAEV